MSATITDPATPAEQAPEDHLPVAVWRIYRQKRQMFREKQRESCWMALDECGYTSQRNRERIGGLLVKRENERGLGSTPEEEEQEIALEAAEVEAGGFVAEPEPEPGSREAIEVDARRRVDELRTQIERMSPEALVDAKAATEQKAAESELAEAERALVNVTRARGEISRREESASEAAERQVREQGEADAQALQPQIRKAAERLDVQASTFAECAVAFQELKEAQAGAVARSGRGQEAVRGRSFRRREVAAALYVALREHNLGDAVEKFSGSNRDEPLAAGEPEKL